MNPSSAYPRNRAVTTTGASAKVFTPYEHLAHALLPEDTGCVDGAHDCLHLQRVWRNAKQIHSDEGGDLEIIAAAVLLHDSDGVPKNSPHCSTGSTQAAENARLALHVLGWPEDRIDHVAKSIISHSFSARLKPTSLEGDILQDADRLDAIGFIGIARCFYTAGVMRSTLYEEEDPPGLNRSLDDQRFALDHFPHKLLRLADGFRTSTGQVLAAQRAESLRAFYDGLLREITI